MRKFIQELFDFIDKNQINDVRIGVKENNIYLTSDNKEELHKVCTHFGSRMGDGNCDTCEFNLEVTNENYSIGSS
jgi:hypothetical protein